MATKRTKIGIACQGGGSQTAFTAGALKGLFEEGNVSLFQQLDALAFINDLLLQNALRPEFLRQFDVRDPVRIPYLCPVDERRPYHIPFIEMSLPLQATLDYESKLDRSPENISRLIADGEKQARVFLKERQQEV